MSGRRKWRRRFLALGLSLLLLLVLLEIGARVYMWGTNGISVFHPSDAVYKFYPQLRGVEEAPVSRDDDRYDVLLLGGSVMRGIHAKGILKKQLEDRYGEKLALHSVATAGQTSLDSFHQYRRLDKPFDLIVLYQAINETRANNCPEEVFREDYSHYFPYPLVTPLMEGDGPDFALPILIRYLWVMHVLEPAGKLVPVERPRAGWEKYGDKIKTKASYKKNVTEIVRLARKRGTRVLLVTFAYHVPENYTQELYNSRQLDYAPPIEHPTIRYQFDIETWGLPKNVTKGIDEHNKILQKIAAANDNADCLDLARTFPKRGALFRDICHISDKGHPIFADRVAPKIVSMIESDQGGER